MQKRNVSRLLFSSALLALALPIGAWAEDGVIEGTRIRITMRNGKPVVEDAAPNPPITVPQLPPAPAAVTTQPLDDRMPDKIQDLVHYYSKTHGVDPQLVAAVMRVESNYDRRARSPKGALGLMQLIPSTGTRFGVQDFFDPAQNIEGGVKYLRFLSDKFSSNIDLVLAAYNAGENLVARLGNRVPSIPETQDYVRKIKTIYKPSAAPALVAASEDVKPVVQAVAPEPKTTTVYTYVDARGVIHLSNIGPPN